MSVRILTTVQNAPPTVTVDTTSLPAGTVNVVYSTTLAASGGTSPYTWTGSPLPAGLTLSTAGVLSGTPTTAGSTTINVVATDANSVASASTPLTVTIAGVTVTVTTTTLPTGVVGTAYSATLAATGGTSPYTWVVTGLPAPLTASAAGVISGTPTGASSGTITATATDSASHSSAATNLTLTINSASTVTVTTASLPTATVGTAYTTTLAAAGGTPPYTWTATGVPGGLTLSSAGVLSGTPTSAAIPSIVFTATDSTSSASPTKSIPLTVYNNVTGTLILGTTQLPDAYVGIGYAAVLSTAGSYPSTAPTGGTGPYTWTVSGQPAWLTVNPDGTMTGTPPATGIVNLTASVTDAVNSTNPSPTPVTFTIKPAGSIWFGAMIPNLPTRFTTTYSPPAPTATNRGSYYTPGVGADSSMTLQAAINAAAAATGANGDVIVLQAGTTYTNAGPINLMPRSGSGWIYIASSNTPGIGSGTGLPAAGTRVGRGDIPNMASLRNTQNVTAIIGRPGGAGTSYYRLVGLDIQRTDATNSLTDNCYCISFAMGDTSLSTLANHITIDRCYIAGAPNNGMTHGIGLEGQYMEACECWIERAWSTSNDSQAIIMYNSPGPFRIHNNYLMGMGETTMTGGSDTTLPIPNMPEDIEITNNHYRKIYFEGTASTTAGSTTMTVQTVTMSEVSPMCVMYDLGSGGAFSTTSVTRIVSQLSGTTGGPGTYQLSQAAVNTVTNESVVGRPNLGKNMIEFKSGQRILVDSNFFEHAFGTQQTRTAAVLTSRNQSGTNPWYLMGDVTFTNNIFTNAWQGGINHLIQDGGNYWPTQPGFRVLFRNNLFLISNNDHTVGTTVYMSQSNRGQVNNTVAASANGYGGDIIFDHNTFVGPVGSPGLSSILTTGGQVNVNMALTTMVFSNNIWDGPSQWGMTKGGTPGYTWVTSIVPSVAQPTGVANAIVAGSGFNFPAGNYYPANTAAIGFTSYGSIFAGAGYALTTASPYHGVGVSGAGLAAGAAGTPDSTDLGCNVTTLPTS